VSTDAIALLAPFRDAGVLAASDVHVAAALSRLAGVVDRDVILAVALAARAPRVGHVCVDLRTIAELVTSEIDDPTAPVGPEVWWPDPSGWIATVAASTLVTAHDAPLVLDGALLYLERYHAYQQSVADHLRTRATTAVPAIATDPAVAERLLRGDGADQQREVVATAVRSALTVLVGGPGTGKTTTVAALLATLVDADPGLRVALAAPTGKAAARLGEAFGQAAAQLPGGLGERLRTTDAVTIHRLLGSGRDGRRFRHGRDHPLPHDVVIVDETSMVSLPLMARLLDAVRPDARLVLVGDPGQLASVEAGSVLADLVGPAGDRPSLSPLSGCISELRHSRRFPEHSPLAALARSVRAGSTDAALASLRATIDAPTSDVSERGGGSLRWIPVSGDEATAVEHVRSIVVAPAVAVHELARAGAAAEALAALEGTRLLCAHRLGPFGVDRWNARVEGWLRAEGVGTAGWYPGRPVLVTANDYRANLFNGDLGVTVAGETRPEVAFTGSGAGGGVRRVPTVQLESCETVHAMTIHKSQGSEFDHVVVVLPPARSRLATRELLYTAITRARGRVTLVGDEAAVAAAVDGRVERASGLRAELWPVG
jgi:exodeoxyribonuclease V alpha subunit